MATEGRSRRGSGEAVPARSARRSSDTTGQSQDLSSLFTGFSASLDKMSGTMSSSVSQYEKTSKDLVSGFQKVAEKFLKEFSTSGKKMTDKMAEDAEKDDKKKSKTDGVKTADIAKGLENTTEKGLTKFQKISSGLIKSFKIVGTAIFNEFKTAMLNVSNQFKEDLSTITAKMGLSNSQYAELYQKSADRFINEGLNKQFSPVDYSKALTEALATGLRGGEAKEVVYQNLITNKLLPAINTNTVAYRRMGKQFDTSFRDNITAVGKYTESMLGAISIENGQVDAMLDTLETEIRYSAAQRGISTEETDKTISALMMIVEQLESKGIDSSDFIQQMHDAATSTVGEQGNLMNYINGIATPEDVTDALASSENLLKIYGNYLQSYAKDKDNTNALVTLTNSLGGNPTIAKQISTAALTGDTSEVMVSELETLVEKYDKEAVMRQQMDNLQEGWYQTADAALDKIEENLAADTATMYASTRRIETILGVVSGLLGTIMSILMTKTTTDMFKGTGSKTTGKGIGSGGAPPSMTSITGGVGQGTSVFQGGFKTSTRNVFNSMRLDKAGAATRAANAEMGLGSAGATAMTTLSGIALLAAGGIYGGMNAAEAVKNTKGTTGDKVLSGIEGFLGDTSGARTVDEKQAEAQKHKDSFLGLDRKKVGKATATGALIGAGTGTLVGAAAGGVGAAPGALIGGAIGGLTGAVASITEQAVKYGDSIAYAKSELGKMGERINDTVEGLRDMNAGISDYAGLVSEYEVVKEQLLSASGSEKTLLQSKLTLLETEIKLKQAELGTADTLTDKIGVLTNDMAESAAYAELGNKLMSEISTEELESLKDKKIADMDYTSLLSNLGVDSSDATAMVNQAIKAGYLDKATAEADMESAFKKLVIDRGSAAEVWGHNAKGDDLDEFATKGSDAYQALTNSSLKSHSENYAASVSGLSETSTQSLGSLQQLAAIQESELFEMKNMHTAVAGAIGSLVALDSSSGVKQLIGYDTLDEYLAAAGFSEDRIAEYKNYIGSEGRAKANDGRVKGWYKTGIDRIPFDNHLSVLHRDEMVLTAADANALRTVGSGGISGFLQGLLAVRDRASTVTAPAETETSTSSPILDAIVAQTSAVTSILNSIYDLLVQLVPSQSVSPDNSAVFSSDLLSFEGI